MLGWTAVDIPMLVLLPVLLVASGFFSGSETALFGLTAVAAPPVAPGHDG